MITHRCFLLVAFFKLVASAYMTAFGPNRADDTDIKHLEGVAKLKALALTSKKMVMLAGIYGAMNLLSFLIIGSHKRCGVYGLFAAEEYS